MKKIYRLWALRPDAEGIAVAQSERFGRITPSYVLIYTRGKGPKIAVEVKGDDLRRLTDGDRAWLLGCNLTLIAEESAKKQPETEARLNGLVDSLGAELAAEKKRLEGEKTDDGQSDE